MKKYILISIISILISCQSKNFKAKQDDIASVNYASPTIANESDAAVGTYSESATEEKANAPISDESITMTPKIIRNGFITMEIKNFEQSKNDLKSILAKHGAYISDENQTNDNYRIQSILVIKIANDKFESLMNESGKIARKIDSKNITSEDVTEEYIDVTARLKTKKEVEQRYIELLRKASKVSDIIEVENQLKTLREEIESVQGRLNYLQSKTAHSTITLTMYEVKDFQYSDTSPGFLSRIAEAFVSGWNGLVGFVVGIFYLWPFWIFLAGILFFVIRFVHRNKAKKTNPNSENKI